MKTEKPHATFTTLDGLSGLPVAVKVWPDEVDRVKPCHAGGFRTAGSVIHYNSTGFVRVTQSQVEVVDALQMAAEEAKRQQVAEGHNPDRLTEEQVGVADGWRLLAPDEIAERNRTPDIQSWDAKTNKGWLPNYRGEATKLTYRTRKPAGYYLPPKPATPPSEPQGPTEIKLTGGTVFSALYARRKLLWDMATTYVHSELDLTRDRLLTEIREIDKALAEIMKRGYACSITLTK